MIDFIRLPSGRLATLVRCQQCEQRIINQQRGIVLITNLDAPRHVHTAILHKRCVRRWLHAHRSNQRWYRNQIPAMFFAQEDQAALRVIDLFRKMAVGAWSESLSASALQPISA